MRTDISQVEVDTYRHDGFVVLRNFLDTDELEHWRGAVAHAVTDRAGIKIPGRPERTGEDDGINQDAAFFGNVFDQLINLWQTDDAMRSIILDPRIGEIAARLSGADGIRVWHDQALIKKPWANPTTLHTDAPYWSFESHDALSIWVALDDATMENGCLYFMPGSHQATSFAEAGISANMNAVFAQYPELAKHDLVAAPMKAGDASFHNALCVHGAGPNMTPRPRRAMTCAFMPDGGRYNGKLNVLPEAYAQSLSIGDLLDNEEQNPLLFARDLAHS